jgi:hypothetical protein
VSGGQLHMSERPISEKALEILFNRYLLQSFPLGAVQLLAPTTFEEFRSGYDSKVVGFSSLRELYLQFKSPLYSETRDRFTVTPTRHQHLLLKQYPQRTAYYVASTLRSLTELNAAQRDLASAADFLRHFICIEVSALPEDVSFFHYTKPASHRESPRLAFKTPQDGKRRTAPHHVNNDGWLRGSALLSKFRTGDVGATVLLDARCDAEESWGQNKMFCPDLYEVAGGLSASEYGILLRMPLE